MRIKLSKQGQILRGSSYRSQTVLPFELREDLCSVQRETAERKLVKISSEWFCHNNGIKKHTGNLLAIVGTMPLFW